MARLHEVPGCRVLSIENGHESGVVMRVRGRRCAGRCPGCGTPSAASHGSYQRHPADLPSLGRAVRLDLTVRRRRCLNPSCHRRVERNGLNAGGPALLLIARRWVATHEAMNALLGTPEIPEVGQVRASMRMPRQRPDVVSTRSQAPESTIVNDRRHTAIHEAGYAVIGRVVTMLCGGASIVAEEDSAGHSITADPYTVMAKWQEREKWREPASIYRGRIIAIAAGAEAAEEILGASDGGDGDDRYQIALMLAAVADEAEHDRLEVRLRRFARQLVRRHRADIERVAAALEERETMTGEEIDALLPPTFMSQPTTWALALAEAEECEDAGSLHPQR